MKILQIVARVPSPPVDGGAMYVHYITENLLREGHDVHLAGFISNKHPQNTDMLKGAKWHLIDGEYRPYYPWAFIGSELKQLPVTVSYRMKRDLFDSVLEKIEYKPEVILLEGVFVGHFIPNLRRKFSDVPIVLRSSNVEYQVLERNAEVARWPVSWVYRRQATLMKSFEFAVMQQVDGLTAITSADKEVLSAMNPDVPSAVVTAGTTFPGPPDAARQRTGVIGCIADWSWQPNRDGLTWFIDEIWPKIKALQPELKMEVAGGKMSAAQQSRLKEVGITYLGFVDSADVFRQSLSVIVIPLLSGGGMKLKTVEAMGSRIPFVSTSIGVEGIDITHNEHALIADDSETFAQYVDQLLTDEALRNRLTQHALDRATERYDWASVTRQMVDFFLGVLR